MTAETDIAAIDDGGANTAAEVRTALTSVLGRADSHKLIEEITLGVDGTFTFDVIPATSSDLQIVGSLRSDRATGLGDNVRMRVGATSVDSGSNYAWSQVGSGGASSNGDTAWTVGVAKSDASVDSIALPVIIDIPSYADTSFVRGFLARTTLIDFVSQTNNWTVAGIWNNTVDAIDIIELFPENGTNFKAGSVARLYGLG